MLRMIWYSELLIENEYIENTSEKGVVEDFRERVGFRLAKFSTKEFRLKTERLHFLFNFIICYDQLCSAFTFGLARRVYNL
jgi:hypothetical protein